MNLSKYYIDASSKIPLYKQVEQILLDLLNLEPYNKGAKLPNELEISKELNVSRNTVRKAMYALLNRGLIVRKKNRGTFKNIDNSKIKTTLNNWYSFNDDMQKQNRNFKILKSSASLIIPNDEIRVRLGLSANKKVLKLLRVKGDIEPEMYVESYIHPDLDIELKDLRDGNILKFYQFLEKRANVRIATSFEDISAAMPSDKDRKYLDIGDDTVMLIRKMLIVDELDKKLAYSIGYYLSNKFIFNLHIQRQNNEK